MGSSAKRDQGSPSAKRDQGSPSAKRDQGSPSAERDQGSPDPLVHVQGYYEALSKGDADEVASFFTDDATHYYTRLGPHRGREIADNAALGVKHLDAQWIYEHGITDGNEAVIEWTMLWTDPKSGARRLDRGTEWFRFRDGKICEVRAYHHSDEKNRSGDLLGFDHAGRGYTTL